MQYRNQIEKLDCGIFVVQTLYKYFYNKWLDISLIKKSAKYDFNGISIINIVDLLKQYGIHSKVLKGNSEAFKNLKIKNPIVSIIKNDQYFHYIIIEKITNKKNIVYYDPIYGKKKIDLNSFLKIFLNVIIICNPSKKRNLFINKQKLSLWDHQYKKEKIFLSIISLFIIFLSVVSTYYIKLVLEYFNQSYNLYFLLIISIIFFFIYCIKNILSSITSYISSSIEMKYRDYYIKKYIEKIEIIKFQNIQHYDESMHLKNIECITKVSSCQANMIVNTFSNIICCIFSFLFLFILNLYIFLFAQFVVGTLILITFIFKKKYRKIFLINFKETTKFKKIFLNIINSIEQFKLNKTKYLLNNQLKDSLETIESNEQQILKTNLIYSIIHLSFKNFAIIFIILFSIIQIMNFNSPIGNLFIYISMFNFFINSSSSIINVILEYPTINQYLENLNGFFIYENENNNLNNTVNINKISKIELKNINYNYGTFNLKINNLIINSHIKLIGKNGSGKSTLMKIISLLIYQNSIYFNDQNIINCNLNQLKKQICYISSNEYLPSCTLYQYLISANDNNPKYLLKNYEKYNLGILLEYMNLELNNNICDDGKNLSIGQKQFIYLLKIFAQDPSLVLLDEIFENIDLNFKEILFPILKDYLENKITIEVSHQNNYIFEGKEIDNELFI